MQVVILTAGTSSRFWPLNKRHKSLMKVMGKPLIWYTIDGLRKIGVKEVIIVQDKKREVEKELENYKFGKLRIRYVVQPEPKGMGDALSRAKEFLGSKFFVLNAERVDGKKHIELAKAKIRKAPLILFATATSTPHLFGILDIKGDKVLGIVEKPDPGKEPSNLKVVGTYGLSDDFFEYHQKVRKHIYDFEDTLNLLIRDKGARVVNLKKENLPLKYSWHLFGIVEYLMDEFLKRKISKTARIAKNVTIEGKVHIGKNARIYEGAVIKGPCYIGDNVIIGNNAIVRKYTDLEDGVMIGAGAEVARSVFQEGVHIHSGYFGDSIIGKNTKIGAGTVTANAKLDRGEIKAVVKGKKINTQKKRLGVIMGENVKVGINVSFMPGIMIGSNSIIGPHSVVFNNIPDNTKFYTKFSSVIRKL